LAADATGQTECQPAVTVFSRLANGSRKVAVHFAVERRLAFSAVYPGLKTFVQVAGNSEKISPRVSQISLPRITNGQGE
jgi:hypothetical protein